MTFDDADIESSCMWVMPGHHKDGVIPHNTKAGGLSLLPGADIDESLALPVELKAGSCMLHHGAMPHRTLPNTSARPRRAVAIHFVSADSKSSSESRNSEPAENKPVARRGGSTARL